MPLDPTHGMREPVQGSWLRATIVCILLGFPYRIESRNRRDALVEHSQPGELRKRWALIGLSFVWEDRRAMTKKRN